MDVNVWTTVVIPLAVAVVSGVVQLVLEYAVFQPTLRRQAVHQTTRQPSGDSRIEPSRSAQFESLFLGFTRVLVIFVLAFGSVSVAASIGYEVRQEPGVIWGTVVGLTLTLSAMWAINKWSDKLAVMASVMALVALVTLVLAGFVTLVAELIGLTVNFSEGLLIVVFGALFIVSSLIVFGVMIIFGILEACWFGSGHSFGSGNQVITRRSSAEEPILRKDVHFVGKDEWTRK